jgi:hypothetical protein
MRWSGMKKFDGTMPVTDFSWVAPDPNMHCWEKFNHFYLSHFVKLKE